MENKPLVVLCINIDEYLNKIKLTLFIKCALLNIKI